MEKRIIEAGVPETGGPFNLCVRHGDTLYVSGLPPFEEDYCACFFYRNNKGHFARKPLAEKRKDRTFRIRNVF